VRFFSLNGGTPDCRRTPSFVLDLCDFCHAGPWYESTGSAFPRLGAAVGGSIFILVVDDDAAFADAAARSFESVGMRTAVALGSTAAIDGFDSNAIDVVVTDIKLPEGEPRGSVLARMIKNKRPHVPVILMTAHPELLKQEVALPGAALWRPLEIAELCRAIKVRLAQ
jgi:CheY-like chemotaxis protein